MVDTTSTLLGRGKPANLTQLTDQLRLAVRTGVFAPGEKLPTIRQLSSETGLANNVVSRAFTALQAEGLLVTRKRAGTFVRSHIEASEETQERAALRIFALVAPELSSGYYPLLQRGFDFAAAQRGYQIVTSNTDNDVRYQADTILQLMDKGVSGIALVPATLGPSPAHHIRQLQRNGIPVVLLHRGVEGVQAPLLRIPTEEVGRIAATSLIEAGHTRLAFCAGQRAGAALGYERGFRLAIEEAGLELPEAFVHHGDMTLINNEQYTQYEQDFDCWFERQVARPDRPTAIFTSFEPLGEIAYLAAVERGLKVHDDLAIATIGGRERRSIIGRRLACVTLDEERAGDVTAQLLDDMCREKRAITDDEVIAIDVSFDSADQSGALHA